MAGQWYYRMFGQDFGPVPLQELKSLAETGTISTEDEVRREDEASWVPAGSVGELHFPGAAAQKPIVATSSKDSGSNIQTRSDEWFTMFHGQEMGPLKFDELIEFARQGQLNPDDEVKLGSGGKWRRVGSIGRLVAVLPYQEPKATSEPKTPSPAPAPVETSFDSEWASLPDHTVPDHTVPEAGAPRVPQAPSRVTTTAVNPPPAQPAFDPMIELETIKAQAAKAAYEATDAAAKQMVAWAFSPHCDPNWWAWIGGIEMGPVDFAKLFDWAKSGHLQPTDQVRNGFLSAYSPSTNVPGLYQAVGLIKRAAEALQAVESRLAAAKAAVVAPVSAQARISVQSEEKTRAEAPIVPQSPAVASSGATNRPVNLGRPGTTTSRQNPGRESVVTTPTDSQPIDYQEETPARPARRTVESQATPARSENRSEIPVSDPVSRNSTSTASAYSRPMEMPTRPAMPIPASRPAAPSRSSKLNLKWPAMIGCGVVLAAGLVAAGWNHVPSVIVSADVGRYTELRKLLDEVKSKRAANSTDFGDVKAKADKLVADYVPIYKSAGSDSPAKQALLWAVRDELPQMMKEDLTVESRAEKAFGGWLNKAKQSLAIQ